MYKIVKFSGFEDLLCSNFVLLMLIIQDLEQSEYKRVDCASATGGLWVQVSANVKSIIAISISYHFGFRNLRKVVVVWSIHHLHF